MCTSLPKVHIAIMGMERIVADLSELDVVLAVLARSATGQALSVYTNIISGPRREDERDGPKRSTSSCSTTGAAACEARHSPMLWTASVAARA
jgi:hypothetical protein